MRKMTGGCLCGAVRYSVEAEPIVTAVCHCKNCQQQSGSAFSIEFAVPSSAVSVQGRTKTFHEKGDSGKAVERRFCPECGSGLISWGALMPDALFIKAGTLDDTSWISPTMEVYCDRAQPWVRLAGDMKKFPKAPSLDELIE
jgi:hypothetical protein